MLEDLPKADELAVLVSLLAPGFIILTIRASVQGGPRPEFKESAFLYAAFSAVYFSIAGPIFNWPGGAELTSGLWSFLRNFAAPLIVGILAAYEVRCRWIANAARAIGLQVAKPIPTAWDAAFRDVHKGTFVLVTLVGGEEVAGLMGRRSFASSSTEERDLFIEEVWQIAKNGVWKKASPERSIVLCGRDIRHVEIFEENTP